MVPRPPEQNGIQAIITLEVLIVIEFWVAL